MRFRLFPTNIRKDIGFEEGALVQTLCFTTAVRTADQSFDQSKLADGRKIDSLPCHIFLGASKDEEFKGTLIFQPKYISEDRDISSTPDYLFIQARLPVPLFRELWATIDNAVRIVFFVTVTGMTSIGALSLSPYRWDINNDEDRFKDIELIKFAIFTQAASDTELSLNMDQRFTDIACDLSTAGRFTASTRERVEERHPPHSQRRRLRFKAIEQAEAEAVLRGLSKSDTDNLAEEVVNLIDNAHAGVRAYQSEAKELDPTRLWLHQDLLNTFAEGRSALGHWQVGPDQLKEIARALIDRPWLRIDEFEWIIVDALIFREVFEFGENVKTPVGSFTERWAHAASDGNLRKLPWQRLKAYAVSWTVRWGALVAGMWATWTYVTNGDYSDWPSIRILGSAFFILFYLLIGLPIGRKTARLQKQHDVKLLLKMNNAYNTLRPVELLSPNQIRAALLTAQDQGACWDAAALALLDRAALRDPPLWML